MHNFQISLNELYILLSLYFTFTSYNAVIMTRDGPGRNTQRQTEEKEEPWLQDEAMPPSFQVLIMLELLLELNFILVNLYYYMGGMSGVLQSCQVSITEYENLKYQGVHKNNNKGRFVKYVKNEFMIQVELQQIQFHFLAFSIVSLLPLGLNFHLLICNPWSEQ